MTKIETLADHLGIEAEDIEVSRWHENTFEADGEEYRVLTDAEADEAVAKNIKDSLWAFNPGFILTFLGVSCGRAEDAFGKMLSTLCEDANPFIAAMLGDKLPEFVERAVSYDGRGHFLASYDSAEIEAGDFYIYRTN